LPRPDLLLLNGGVFQAPLLVNRLLEVLGGWYQGNAPELLEHTSLDTSVARGAVRYGLSLRGIGSVITGGTAKAYYVGIEHEGRPRALCVAPRNVDPGTRSSVPDRLFQLRVNEPVIFPLFTYTGDRVDAPGTLLDVAMNADELEPLAPLQTLVRGQTAKVREVTVSVRIESSVDEAGSLRVALATVELPPRRWTLEFAAHRSTSTASAPLAGDPTVCTNAAAPSATSSEPPVPPHPAAAKAARELEVAFSSADEGAVLALRAALEARLGPRGEWSLATCRVLADACLGTEKQRGRSAAHELNWLRLLSWTMRPGIGTSGDGGRVDALWGLEPAGPVQPNKANWTEWWITWRRVAPGLDASRQLALFERVRRWLWPEGKASGGQMQGPVEAMRMVAALESLPAAAKTLAGTRFLEQVKKLGSYWPLGRVGARRPLQGTAANVVPRAQAEAWLATLFELDWEKADGAAFAAASLARVTGDPVLDVSAALRHEVAERLTRISANATWIDMVLRETHLDANDVKRVLGDSLPAGLRLD
jgi:hypothetical protein